MDGFSSMQGVNEKKYMFMYHHYVNKKEVANQSLVHCNQAWVGRWVAHTGRQGGWVACVCVVHVHVHVHVSASERRKAACLPPKARGRRVATVDGAN